jgi:hypothetical protein
MPQVGFEPTIAFHTLDRAYAVTGDKTITV